MKDRINSLIRNKPISESCGNSAFPFETSYLKISYQNKSNSGFTIVQSITVAGAALEFNQLPSFILYKIKHHKNFEPF